MFTPITPKDLTWTSKYNCYTAYVANGLLRLGVNWHSDGSGSGYKISVNDITLKALEPDCEKAKQLAIRLAVKYLKMAAVELCSDIE